MPDRTKCACTESKAFQGTEFSNKNENILLI